MQFDRDDDGHQRIATFDIETTHYDAKQGEVVSIGVGLHERGTPGTDAEYDMYHRDGGGEAALIRTGFSALDDLDADVLVTFNGQAFDFGFLTDRLYILGESNVNSRFNTDETHVDLLADRKAVCKETGQRWPNLEKSAASYGWTVPEASWRGGPVTNKRFGEELGPAFLNTIRGGSDTASEYDELCDVVESYLVTDLEANLAIYYGDIGETFEPAYLE